MPLMPPKAHSPEDPGEWLARARSNLIQAKAEQPGVYLEDLCFQAQQAAEKALKGLLLHRGTSFPRVHDLARLVTLLENDGEEVPKEIREVVRLNGYAVEARYPGVSEPVSPEEYAEALRITEETLQWVAAKVEGQS